MCLPSGCAGGWGPRSIGGSLTHITGKDKKGGLPWFNFFIRRDIEECGGCQVAKAGCYFVRLLEIGNPGCFRSRSPVPGYQMDG
jgi:hypothetical protein